VDLECRSQTNYFGPLYAGSEYEELTVIYDTMSRYTAIALKDADGLIGPSYYDVAESDTAK